MSRSFAFLTAFALVFTAATVRADDDVTGILSVGQTFQIIDKDGKARTLQGGGSYQFNVDPDGDAGKQVLKLNLKKFEGKDRQAKLYVGANTYIDAANGPVAVKGNLVGQPFDIQGAYTTSYSQGGQYEKARVCTAYRQYECRCEIFERWNSWRHRYERERVCQICEDTYFGTRIDLVHDNVKRVDLNLAFLPAGSLDQLAAHAAAASAASSGQTNPDGSPIAVPAMPSIAPLASFTGSSTSSYTVTDIEGSICR